MSPPVAVVRVVMASFEPQFLERIRAREQPMRTVQLPVDARRQQVLGLRCRNVHVELRQTGRRPVGDRRLLIFVAAEEERAIANERPAEREPLLRLVQRCHGAGDEILGVHRVVAQIVVARSVEGVRPGLGHRVDDGPGHAAVFGVVAVGQHFDLGDDLLAVALGFAAGALPGDAQTVHLVARRVVSGGAGANVARIAARARHHRDEVEPVAAVQRQRLRPAPDRRDLSARTFSCR